MTKLTDSAIYVDFDNVYSNLLSGYGQQAANLFTSNIPEWMNYLGTINNGNEESVRVFRKRVVYANPVMYGRFRHNFTSNGFRFVDCPVLTAQGKTATDAFLITDVVRDSILLFKYEDFVVVSSDADFSPVLLHLNEVCKNSVLVSVGPASSDYTRMATHSVDVNEFVNCFGAATDTNEGTESSNEEPVVVNTIKRRTPGILHKTSNAGPQQQLDQLNSVLRFEVLQALKLPQLSQEEYKFVFDTCIAYVAANKNDKYYMRSIIQLVTRKYSHITREQVLAIIKLITYDKIRTSSISDILFDQYKLVNDDPVISYDELSEILIGKLQQ